jgi:hypothetical protein
MHKKYRFIILDNDINIVVPMLLKDTFFDNTVCTQMQTQTKVNTLSQELPELFGELYVLRIRQEVTYASNDNE